MVDSLEGGSDLVVMLVNSSVSEARQWRLVGGELDACDRPETTV